MSREEYQFIFDKQATAYDEKLKTSLSVFGEGDISIYADYKVQILKQRLPVAPKNILEFGCGTGRNLPFLQQYFPTSVIYGCDTSAASLAIAAQTLRGGGCNKLRIRRILLPATSIKSTVFS